MIHSFHIPVLGLAFSIDTPLKVARYGISSTISIVDDMLIERMREYYTRLSGEGFEPIADKEVDARARRITAYLDLVARLVDKQFKRLQSEPLQPGSDSTLYFELLPDGSSLKQQYQRWLHTADLSAKQRLEAGLRQQMQLGRIDVNIMSKVDKLNYAADGQLLDEKFSDALASLRGFADSRLASAVILSAGMNPRLYGYLETFSDFYPDGNGTLRKQIILKVSDLRSAFIQAKFLAKKGLWVSEFRIESGLNCGGHAFATDGFLLGPVLEEFKERRSEITEELTNLYRVGLQAKGIEMSRAPAFRVSVQGGIGTAEENKFLLDYYELDGTGWGSPFLMVPEVTNVDEETLQALVMARQEDFYISGASPLGVPFQNFKGSSANRLRLERIAKGKPGAPCTKKYLISDTEFTDTPICTASREYQRKKLAQLDSYNLSAEEYRQHFDAITEKECLCEGLAAPVYHKYNLFKPKESRAVSICPGPNMVYFSGVFSLADMVKHIYGKVNLLAGSYRPNMFVKELNLYIDYWKKDLEMHLPDLNAKKAKLLMRFQEQLEKGISYYKSLIPRMANQTDAYLKRMYEEVCEAEGRLKKSISSLSGIS